MLSTRKKLFPSVLKFLVSCLIISSVSYAEEITGFVVYEKPFNTPSSLTINDTDAPVAPDLGNNATQGNANAPVYDGIGRLIGYTHRSAGMRWTKQVILTSDDLATFKSSGKSYTIRILINGEAARFPKFPGMLYEDDSGKLDIFARIACEGPVGGRGYSRLRSESRILTDKTAPFSFFKTWDDFDINACAGPLRLADAYVSANKFRLESFVVQLIEL